MPRDAVSRTANVERNGGHKWVNAVICCHMRFVRKKSSIEIFYIPQFESYCVRGMSLPFVDSCKDLGILVDTELKLHGHLLSIVGKSSGMSVNLQNSTLCSLFDLRSMLI